MSKASSTFRRAGWLMAAAPFFGISTGALFPLIALELDRLGFGAAFIGSATSLYYAGSVTGALSYGWVVNRVGYKVAFFAAAMLAGVACFALTQFNEPEMWLGLRFLGGYALGGYYIVVDSWVTALGTRQTRGRLYASFETLRLLATATGPLLIIFGATTTSFFWVSTGYLVSFVPALFNEAPPPNSNAAPFASGIINMARCFPFALAVAFCGGVANASFYGLSAVYAKAIGFDSALIALFVSLVLVAPAVTAIPVGALADRFRRMPVAACVSGLSMVSCLFVWHLQPTSFWMVTGASIVVGGCLVPLYALGLSRIVDAVGEQDAIIATTAGLLAYNAGAFAGPIAAGFAVELVGPTGFYVFLGGIAFIACLLAIADMMPSRCCPEDRGVVCA